MARRINRSRSSSRGTKGTFFSRVKNSISSKFSDLRFGERRKSLTTKTTKYIKRRPMASFFIALVILLLVMILNTILTPKPKEANTASAAKEVAIYQIGKAPRATFSAKIDKKGVIQIVAQTPGIVSGINVVEGQVVTRGQNLVSLSSNYQGGNALSVSREIAATQYMNTKDTFDTQKGIIGNQREIADQSRESADEQRQITEQSITDTRRVIDLNASIIVSLETSLSALESSGGAPDQILGLRQQIAQYRAGQAQLEAAQRQARFAADTNNPPTRLADLAHDLTLKQLDVQEKALRMGLEISKLQLQLAQISEATMYPAAPFDGVVEKVHVSYGQAVNPGTPLVTISSNNQAATATVTVPYETAGKVSRIEESTFYIKGKKYNIMPEFVSNEATDGPLNSVIYALPDTLYSSVTDGQYIKVEIPIGNADSVSTIPYLPIDIVFQTQEGAYTYVAKNGKVVAKKVELGDIVGSNVAITAGLGSQDSVILDRNVIEGEKVKISN